MPVPRSRPRLFALGLDDAGGALGEWQAGLVRRLEAARFDGVPIDVAAAFPPEPASGPDGPYPLIMLFHGYGGAKHSMLSMQPWVDRGYATFTMTSRGFGESCGTAASRAVDPAGCANGYIRFNDARYEVRDAQEFAGLLADESRILPQNIGALGGSYGGAMSMSLAALKDRKMLTDGSLVPWQSPSGKAMRIAAAAPEIPWSDVMDSLMPNGGTLDYIADARYRGRTGVRKQSFEDTLYNVGTHFFLAPQGSNPDADLTSWHNLMAGESPTTTQAASPTRDRGHARRADDASLRVLHRPLAATCSHAHRERVERRPVSRGRGHPASTTARAPSTRALRSRWCWPASGISARRAAWRTGT